MFEVKAIITVTRPGEQPRTLSELSMRANNKGVAYAFGDHMAKGVRCLFRKLMDATSKKLAEISQKEEAAPSERSYGKYQCLGHTLAARRSLVGPAGEREAGTSCSRG